MASDVDIYNLALSRLGQEPSVNSINPHDNSVEASIGAWAYPMALKAMLELHDWNFATTRKNGSPITNPSSTWKYAYAKPSDALRISRILPSNAVSDYIVTPVEQTGLSGIYGSATPTTTERHSFAIETDVNGNELIFTNVEDAVIVYIREVSNPAKFSGTFTEALAWMLASMVAGPLIKGKEGRATALECQKTMLWWLSQATGLDVSQLQVQVPHLPQWLNR